MGVIDDIKTNLRNAYTKLETKGATIPAHKNMENLESTIDSVQTGITPTGNINITDTNQTDVTNYATAQVVDANLTAGNIKNGVSILGVQGTALVTTITVNQDNSIDLTIA